MRRLVRVLAPAVVSLLWVAVVAAPASAHTSLIGVDPAEGATVAAGDQVTLAFSEDLLSIGAEASLIDSTGAAAQLEVSSPTASSVRVSLPPMAAGQVTLAWRVVAGDGHPIEGSLTYAAKAPDPVDVAATSSPSPSAATAGASGEASAALTSASASPVVSGSADDDGATGGTNSIALWVAVFAALLASSVAIMASKRRR